MNYELRITNQKSKQQDRCLHNSLFLIHNSESGMALLATVVAVLLILVAVGLSMISLGIFEGFMAESQRASDEAYAAAQSGAKDAMMRVARNKNYSSAGYSLPASCTLNGAAACAYIVVEQNQPSVGKDRITAAGTLNNSSRKLEVILNVNSTNGKITIDSQNEL